MLIIGLTIMIFEIGSEEAATSIDPVDKSYETKRSQGVKLQSKVFIKATPTNYQDI